MLKRTIKLAWFKRNRYVLTVVAIAMSVAFIVSTLLLTTSIADVGQPISRAYANVDAVIVGRTVSESDGPMGAVDAAVPAQVVADLADAGHTAVGLSDPYAQVLTSDGNPGGQDLASDNVAEPWLGDSPLNAFEIADGSAPAQLGEAALDVTTADAARIAVGDTFDYVTGDGLQTAELVGTVTFGGAENNPYTSSLLLTPDDPLFSGFEGFSRILVSTQSDIDELVPLAPGSEVMTGDTWAEGEIDLIGEQLSFFETFLTVFAVIAVIVGMVIVTNTFAVSLAQRTQELALLRLVGTTRRQLMGQVVLEAVLLGAVGAALGVVLGIGGVSLLNAFLDALGLSIERSDSLSMPAIGIGVAVGLGVTVLASVWPARKATAVAPIEALRSSDLEPPSAGRKRGAAAAVMALAGIVCLFLGMTDGSVTVAGVGIGATFAALYLGAGQLVQFAARLARPLLGLAGPTGIVASRNLERNAGRTSAASSALMIGIGLVAFFTLMAATIGQFMVGDSANGLRADHVVQGIGTFAEPVVGDETVSALAATDGVDQVVAIRTSPVQPLAEVNIERPGPGGETMLAATAPIDGLRAAYDFDVIGGSLDDVSGTSIALDEATADALDVGVGGRVPVQTVAGDAQLEVVAIVASSLPGTPTPSVIGDTSLDAAIGIEGPALTVYVLGPADERSLTDAVAIPTLDVLSTDEYIDGLGAGLDTILSLVYALLAVAIIIALVGIANTVSLAISERAGEIAAIRAAGGSSRQMFWSLLAEFGLLALVGIVAGLGLAWIAATAMFQALSEGAISYPETSLVSGLTIVAIGMAGGIGATWWQARTASRADLLDVLRAD